MNQKDRNLVKACALLVLLVLALGFAFNKALHLAGDPLRVVGAIFSAYYLARAAVAVARRRRRPKVRARRRALSLSLSRALTIAFLHAQDLRKLGKWAIVTGCTGGLGQGFAETLARRGFNLLLISRSATKLDALAKELRSAHSIEARFLTFDFLNSVTGSADELEFFDQTLPKTLDELDNDVALLVNNVGVGNENPHLAPEVRARAALSPSLVVSGRAASSPQVDLEEEAAMVRVNCGAAVRMCRVLLPRFAARRSGAVLNISSGSCNQPSPCVARALSRVLRAPRESESAASTTSRAQLPRRVLGDQGLPRAVLAVHRARVRGDGPPHLVRHAVLHLGHRPLRQRQGVGQRAAGAHHRERRAQDARERVGHRARARLRLQRARAHGLHLRVGAFCRALVAARLV